MPHTANLVQLLMPSSLSAFANGDLVNAWADTSGAGNSLSSSGTNRPEKITDGVRFVDRDFLSGPMVNVGTSGLTIFMVISNAITTNQSGGLVVIHDGSTDVSSASHIVYENAGFMPNSNSQGTVTIANIGANKQVLIDRFASGSSSFGLYPYMSRSSSFGTNMGSGSAGIIYGARQFNSASPTPQFYARYDLHAAIVFNATLTEKQMIEVASWLLDELGIIDIGGSAVAGFTGLSGVGRLGT